MGGRGASPASPRKCLVLEFRRRRGRRRIRRPAVWDAMAESKQAEDPSTIDEGLYSRQLYVMGHEAQRRMASSDVLIIGMNGLGVEIAKNVILAGVRSVAIHDATPAGWSDLASQFYIAESDIGQPRAAVSLPKLAELNEYVRVRDASASALDAAFISTFGVVVCVDVVLSEQLRINDLCRASGAAFIAGDARGVCGSVFCDFGSEFVCSDMDGEPAASAMICAVTQESPGAVSVLEESRHGLATGDVVAISGVEGMEELNGTEQRVTVTGPYTFEIAADTSGFGRYVRGGYINQVKQPTTLSFKPLSEAIESPGEFLLADFAKMDRPPVLHMAFRGLHAYQAANGGALPRPGDSAAAEQVYEHAVRINSDAKAVGGSALHVENLEEQRDVILRFALSCAGSINPMCAALGGVLGQEVLKACSGKFCPIRQWFYLDALEALSDEPLPEEEVAAKGTRYDGQVAVFGAALQERLCAQRYFLVGAGAIGCEMLKNWAMMGVGCGSEGLIHVTDMDHIERSNLSRQFLFRPRDIGSAKSTVAGAAVQAMNGAMRVRAWESKVAPDTEDIFDAEFYGSLNGVCTALDNIDARLYMDGRCLFYKLPMLESGTMGTKGNTQVVVPHLTENYGATRDPPEKSVPVCTLKHYPTDPAHTAQWARDWFEGCFKQAPEKANAYLTDADFVQKLNAQPNTRLETLQGVLQSLVDERPSTFEDCVVWARLRYEDMFSNAIKQLLHNFPIDQVTSTGALFWSGSKKPPHPLAFDAADDLDLLFVKAAANLRASVYGIAGRNDDDFFRAFLPSVRVPQFVPRDGLRIATNDAEAEEEKKGGGAPLDVDAEVRETVARLPQPADLGGFTLRSIDFDKDIDSQMELVMAVSNLRSRNYKIPEANMHKARQLAGKIIPAIATTTAMVTGLISLELYKILQQKPLEAYKNGFANLAIPVFAFSEPGAPAKTKTVLKGSDWDFTAWDNLDIDGRGMTLKTFLEHMEEEYQLEVQMLMFGAAVLHSFMSNAKKRKARMPMSILELIETVAGKTFPAGTKYIMLEVMVSDLDSGEDVDIPPVRFQVA